MRGSLRDITRRGAGCKAFLFCLALAALIPALCVAETYEKTSGDVRLLRADAVIVATVKSIKRSNKGDLVAVKLEQIEYLRNRWRNERQSIRLLLPGTVDSENSPQTLYVRAGPVLAVTGRYVFILSGGKWKDARSSLAQGGGALLPVYADGTIGCGSGLLFGIDSGGFVCGSQQRFLSRPLTVTDFSRAIKKRILRAEKIRPRMNADIQGAVGSNSVPEEL